MITLTEIWLKGHDLSQYFKTDIFGQPIQLDRDDQEMQNTGKGRVLVRYANS